MTLEEQQLLGNQAAELKGNKVLKIALDSIKSDAIKRLNKTRTTQTDEIKDAVRVLQIVEGFELAILSVMNDGKIASKQIESIYREPKKRVFSRKSW